ncbi:MAG: Gfo/Idh/MocA family oxidoreductase [Oscillospiraceae bacterium]|nr:Gfo/Idh/MocA family oxidoreductase [Oscillospiraceae bacterium]
MNIGILGTGWIAKKMADTVNTMSKNEDVKLMAVGSRTAESARAFSEKHVIPRHYASYEELCKDSNTDLIYVATPHRFHAENMLMALNADRNVLCEKPFTVNANEARKVIDLAVQKKLFVGEAMWTRFLPLREKFDLVEQIQPVSLTANIGYEISRVQRLYDLELAGGALLDLGVYAINFALMAFGNDVAKIESRCEYFQSGADISNEIKLTFSDGKIANLISTAHEQTDLMGVVTGNAGKLTFKNINNYEWVSLINEFGEETVWQRPEQISGFEYQVRACADAIKQKSCEPCEMPHSEILKVMEIMDEVRRQCKIVYPFE